MPAIINITDPADRYVSAILVANPGKSLLVGYNNKGCSGHKYTFDLIDESQISTNDETVQISGGKVVVGATSLMGLLGSTLDLKEDRFEQQLIWHNPFAVNQCGCGESFQLDGEKACG